MTEPQGTPPAPIVRCRVCARPLDADVQLDIDGTGVHNHCVPQPEEEKHDRHDG